MTRMYSGCTPSMTNNDFIIIHIKYIMNKRKRNLKIYTLCINFYAYIMHL